MPADTLLERSPAPQFKKLPYGEQQGSFRGVVASSNRDDGFFSGENNYVNHLIITGYRYQCVEYARRFLLLTTGCIFDECGRASEVYRKTELMHVETGEKYPFIAHANGTTTEKPQPGDIIIWPYDGDDGMCPWGHIGVISYVDDKRVGIADQNQCFGSFVSPSPDYLDGERCVGRFLDLEHDTDTGAWTVKEQGLMPAPLGWMSYPGTPRREKIYAPFTPLPQFVATRSTPLDDPKHPFIYHLRMPEPLDVPSGGELADAYGLARGTGESAVGAGTAICRVLRFTLQFLFRRDYIGAAFLSLPSNPLQADVKPCDALDRLFSVYEKELGTETGNEAKGFAALAAYFGVPERWITAMQREYAKAEVHMFADAGFALRACKEDIEADSNSRGAAGDLADDDAATPEHAHGPRKIRSENPHDAAWHLGQVSFGTCRIMVEIPQVAALAPAVRTNVEFQLPGYRCFGRPGYSFDFGNYLKRVEELRGPRTAFAIVLSEPFAEMDGDLRELVVTVQSYCEKIKYPVRVVSEADLFYDAATGKLHACISEASPPIASPNTIAPQGDFEVNFVFALAEWDDILRVAPDRHRALHQAALDYEKSDVVFAKPLWSYLTSGLVHRTPEEEDEAAALALGEGERAATAVPLSIKFYDIIRRLFNYATPHQNSETWDQEISEYRDSCRRLGMATPMPTVPAVGFINNCALVDFAMSAFMAHAGGRFVVDPLSRPENVGQPAAVFHLFSTEND